MKNIPDRGNSQCKGSNEHACLAFLRLSKEGNISKAKCVNREVTGHEVKELMGEGLIMSSFVGHSEDFIFYSE